MSKDRILKNAHAAQPMLVQHIFGAAAQPSRWQDVLERIVTLFDARSARLLWMDQSASRVHSNVMVNTDPDYQRQYTDHYVNRCPWRPEIRSKPPGQLYSSYFDFSCSQDEFHRTEFYNDWARPQGIEHGIGGTIFQNDETTVQLLFQRSREAGYFNPDEKAFLNGLVPFLQQAFTLQHRIEELEAEKQLVARAASRSLLPFVLLDGDSRIAYASPHAEKLLNHRNCGLKIQQERLHYRGDSRIHRQLENMIQRTLQAARGHWQTPGGNLALPRHRDRHVVLHITPIEWTGHFASLLPKRCYAAIFFDDRCAEIPLNEAQLALQYGLTPAETQLARLIAQGLNLTSIAHLRNNSIHTVRNQAKSIYTKTGVKGQSELVRLLLGGTVLQR
jgi:DNA-binding CsgD family transcriptional regulator/PAS domain-containing protein